jgi:Spy/CpxP family protein refolding chaperone
MAPIPVAFAVAFAAVVAALACPAAAPAAAPAPGADPYTASLAYARCLREHGLPHPDPDVHGDFRLTPAQEQRLRAVPRARREAAQRACYHHLKGLNLKPLSATARAYAVEALREFSGCMSARGYPFFHEPVVRNMSLGRAFFGFAKGDPGLRAARRSDRFRRAQRTCEKSLSARLDAIIALDRAPL